MPGELSRGMKQKLAIACGLLHSPTVLFFDEPLTGLDPLGIRRMKNSIVQRARAGAAIVLSSHLLHLLEEVCSHVLILKRGVKIADGTLSDVAAQFSNGETRREPRGSVHPRDRRHGGMSVRGILGALLYLRVTSLRNAIASRLRRLKQPKYLVGAVVGVAYFYFVVFRRFTAPPLGSGPLAQPFPVDQLADVAAVGGGSH